MLELISSRPGAEEVALLEPPAGSLIPPPGPTLGMAAGHPGEDEAAASPGGFAAVMCHPHA